MIYVYVTATGKVGAVGADDEALARVGIGGEVRFIKLIETAADLRAFSGPQLVELFNSTNPPKPVKKFENLDKATMRCFDALGQPSSETAAPAPGATEPAEQEDEVKKTAKPKKATKPKKAKVAKEKRTGPNDNVAKTLDLIARQTGATLDEIVERLGVTKGSARNIVGDARRVLVAGDKTSTIKVVEVTSSRRAYKVVAA